MTEQNPGKSERRPWIISPKTPAPLLRESRTVSIYGIMTADVNKNARELAPGVDWSEIIWARACDARGNGYTINSISEEKFVRSLRPVAEQMGWGMSDAEVVYMGGLHFMYAIGKINADRERVLGELNDLKRKFVPEIRQAKIEKTNEEIKRFEGFSAAIENALRRYAARKLTPGWRNYVQDLQRLFDALMSGKEEEIDEMISALSVYPKRKEITEKGRRKKEKTEEKQAPIPQERAIVLFVASPQPIFPY